MTSEELLTEINEKLNRILGILALRGLEDDGEKVRRLRDLGMDNPTIAAVTGLSKNAVAIRISRMRKKGT